MKQYDVAVVGLGIVGASAVYAAAWAGARVLALDAGAPASGTSGASFAWLNSVRKEPEVYHQLNAAGMTAHRELSKELGGDAGHHEGGSLEWAESGADERELRERVHRLASRGYPAEFISRDRARELEPGLAIPDKVGEVAFYGADAWLDAPKLIARLLAAASARGTDILEGRAVRSLRTRGDQVDAIVTNHGELDAESVLVCVGPATQAFLEPLGAAIPVDKVPGLLAITSATSARLSRVVHAPGIHLRPDATGGLRLGAEDIDTLASNSGSPIALGELLLERAARVFPAARQLKVADRRMGVRPMPGDKHTIAGRIPGLANAWMIATHSGITLGPLLGRLMADEIVRGTPSRMLAPFRPERFLTAARA
ncbi:MAG TPA: FAD-dependent oxidoreductase [Methylomirabilota bacterium]|nr:FAD-dependent oxidoreductase [Methylomirabilota bacterium]